MSSNILSLLRSRVMQVALRSHRIVMASLVLPFVALASSVRADLPVRSGAARPTIARLSLPSVGHSEQHLEPSDALLQDLAERQRQRLLETSGPSPSSSVGLPNRGLLRFGMRVNDSDTLYVKSGSRTSRHGTTELVRLINHASHTVAMAYPGSRLLVGDLSSEGGGKLHPHASHQSGRDADVGFYMVNRTTGDAADVGTFLTIGRGGAAHGGGSSYRFDEKRNWALIAALVDHPTIHVQYIFVANKIQALLLREAKRVGARPSTIRRAMALLVQPTHGSPHRTHFHMRIFCPRTDSTCQERPPFYAWHPEFSNASNDVDAGDEIAGD